MMYNGHEELTDSRPEGLLIMVKSTTRKTLPDERIQIVRFCIVNNNNYILIAKEFHDFYGQVYSWVRKYNPGGADKTIDRHDQTRSKETLSEQERLQIEVRMLSVVRCIDNGFMEGFRGAMKREMYYTKQYVVKAELTEEIHCYMDYCTNKRAKKTWEIDTNRLSSKNDIGSIKMPICYGRPKPKSF